MPFSYGQNVYNKKYNYHQSNLYMPYQGQNITVPKRSIVWWIADDPRVGGQNQQSIKQRNKEQSKLSRLSKF